MIHQLCFPKIRIFTDIIPVMEAPGSKRLWQRLLHKASGHSSPLCRRLHGGTACLSQSKDIIMSGQPNYKHHTSIVWNSSNIGTGINSTVFFFINKKVNRLIESMHMRLSLAHSVRTSVQTGNLWNGKCICLVYQQLGSPNIDLFAIPLNHQLLVFLSSVPDLHAWVHEDFAISWKHAHEYAFLPPLLLLLGTPESTPYWPPWSCFPNLILFSRKESMFSWEYLNTMLYIYSSHTKTQHEYFLP